MEIVKLHYPHIELPEKLKGKQLSIAIGHFDGVHRGHQNVINQAVSRAAEKGALSAVMTFHPHPKEVLGQGDQYYKSLTPFEEKVELFKRMNVDVVLVIGFDRSFSSISPEQFVDEVLRALRATQVVVGFDFTFGYKGQGKADTMRELGHPDIGVDIIEPLYENGEKVSSTLVRELLQQGDVASAALLLGRPYAVEGIVVHGDGRGHTIGFPTANVGLGDGFVSPRLGVFAITAVVGGKSYYGIVNHGMKPTFNKEEIRPVMEAHLFDFHQNIYGEPIRIEFHSFVRTEKKFGSVDELIAQIAADVEQTKRLFNLV
ncbi:bifunctional riboflavin kinase/FAD synthetase [Paenibacillus sp. NPDC058071]|uniref:bifunctional riboflavin kinase/FAD synthetase n=1 Tax=Paenibacillus sp. NPDC058071 TaxID=3346326 RepID=UPI0036DE97D6